MISKDQVESMIGATAYSPDGQRVGQVGHVYFDDRSGEPAWASVATGLFGSRESFVPLEDAQFDGQELHLTVDQDTVNHAPNVDPEGPLLSEDEERDLYGFYGADFGAEAIDPERATTDESASEPDVVDAQDSTSTEAVAAYGRGEAGEYERAAGRSDDSVTAAYGRDAASYGREAASGATQAGVAVDAQTLDNLESAGAAGGQRFRTRLRRYLADPAMATRPVAEQVEIEDGAPAEGTDPQIGQSDLNRGDRA